MSQDWRIADHYSALLRAERKALAWEWLRRTEHYNKTWREFKLGHCSHSAARNLGLVRFEDPELPTPIARPFWLSSIDPSVLTARIASLRGSSENSIDLLKWRKFVSIAISEEQDEHLLLSNGEKAIRLDIIGGTLLGCPALLTYEIAGMTALKPKIDSLQSLLSAARTKSLSDHPSHRILDRWILELRVADALALRASHQEIARTLFASTIPERNWRVDDASYRLRIQRLARRARRRLLHPLEGWFG